MEPKTPVVASEDFDKVGYALDLKKEREPKEAKEIPAENRVIRSDTMNSPKTPIKVFTETTDTVSLRVVYGKVKMDTAKLPKQKIVFLLDSDSAHKIWVKLSTEDSLSNLRISQILDSRGNSEGPFGREAEFMVLEKGIHSIVVSENQMQGDAWGGSFRIEANLIW